MGFPPLPVISAFAKIVFEFLVRGTGSSALAMTQNVMFGLLLRAVGPGAVEGPDADRWNLIILLGWFSVAAGAGDAANAGSAPAISTQIPAQIDAITRCFMMLRPSISIGGSKPYGRLLGGDGLCPVPACLNSRN